MKDDGRDLSAGARCAPYLLLVALNGLLFALLAPHGSYFLEDVNSGHLVFARSVSAPQTFYNLRYLYFWVAFRLFGDDPFFFHLVNWVLHTLNVLLSFQLVRVLSGSRAAGMVAAILFSVHYMNTGVVFITKRIDELLAVGLALCAVLLWRRYLQKKKWLLGLLSSSLLFLGLMARASVASFLLLVPLLGFLQMHNEPLLARIGRAIRLSWPLAVVPALAGTAALGWLLLAAGPGRAAGLTEELGSLARGMSCFADSPLARLSGVSLFAAHVFVPLDYKATLTSLTGETPGAALAVSLLILVLGVVLVFAVKAAPHRFFLLWVLAAPIPFLFQENPCEGFAMKEKYLYLPLIGGCALWGLLVDDAAALLARGSPARRSAWRALLCGLLALPLLVSWQGRARARQLAGQVTLQGLRQVGQALRSGPGPRIIYLFLPNEISRYQVFTGEGDLVYAHLPPAQRRPRSDLRFVTIEYPHYLAQGDYDFYRHLGLVVARPAWQHRPRPARPPEGNGGREGDWPPGPGSPPPGRRFAFLYHNRPHPGIEEISSVLFARARIQIRLWVSPPVRSLHLAGDFNGWRWTPLVPDGGAWSAELVVPPGLHRLQIRTEAGRCLDLHGPGLAAGQGGLGRFSLLPVANDALPLGLHRLRGSERYGRIIKLKEQILLDPGNPALHLALARLLERAGFARAAWSEEQAARSMGKGGGHDGPQR